MKNSTVLMGLVVGATMLSNSALATDAVAGGARAPAPATAKAVSGFVDRYASRERGHMATGHATEVTLYPTADREVVFVSFRVAGVERVALVETQQGRVTRFTDFAGARPRVVADVTPPLGDAQAQARSFLAPPPSVPTMTAALATPEHQRTGAQEQAADLLQFASLRTASAVPSPTAPRNGPRSIADSLQMARAFLTSSSVK